MIDRQARSFLLPKEKSHIDTRPCDPYSWNADTLIKEHHLHSLSTMFTVVYHTFYKTNVRTFILNLTKDSRLTYTYHELLMRY